MMVGTHTHPTGPHTNLEKKKKTSHIDLHTLRWGLWELHRHRINVIFLREKCFTHTPPPSTPFSMCLSRLIRNTIESHCTSWKLIVFRLMRRWVRSSAPFDSYWNPDQTGWRKSKQRLSGGIGKVWDEKGGGEVGLSFCKSKVRWILQCNPVRVPLLSGHFSSFIMPVSPAAAVQPLLCSVWLI